MPINPAIALQTQVPQQRSILDKAQQLFTLKDMQQRSRATGLGIQQAEQQIADQSTARQILGAGGNEDETRQALAKAGLFDYIDKLDTMTAAELDWQVKNLDKRGKQVDEVVEAMENVFLEEDPQHRNELYMNVRRDLQRRGNPLAESLPGMFDETLLSQYVDLQTGVDVAKVEADTALTNAQTAGVKAKASAPISVPPSNSLVDPKTHETLYTAPARPSTAAGDKPSRLAELYKKRDLEGLTREETAELEGIEKDKTLVANLYARYDEMTTPGGQTRYVRMSDGSVMESPADLRPQYTASEREELSMMDEIVQQLDVLEQLARAGDTGGFRGNPNIGVVGGNWADIQRKTTGGVGAEVNEMFRISDNIADMLLRARSGAQINEQEYARLRTLIPNPRLAEKKFFSDLTGFRAETQRILERRTGQRPITQPRGTIEVISPDGQEGTIPAEDWPAAQAEGYRRKGG